MWHVLHPEQFMQWAWLQCGRQAPTLMSGLAAEGGAIMLDRLSGRLTYIVFLPLTNHVVLVYDANIVVNA